MSSSKIIVFPNILENIEVYFFIFENIYSIIIKIV
jgi:hypothetical protein